MTTYTTTTTKSNIVILETVKRILFIFKTIFKKVIPLALAMSVLNRLIIYVMLPETIGKWSITANTINLGTFSDSTKILLTLPTIIQYPLFAAMLHYGYNEFNNTGQKNKILDSLKIVARKIHVILIASMLYMLSIAAGCVVLILPGIYILGAFSMVIPSIVIENKGVISSFKYSKSLTKGSILYILLIIACSIVIPNALSMVIGAKIGSFIPSYIFNEVVIILFIALSNTFLASSFTFIYGELELRSAESKKIDEIREAQEISNNQS